MKIEKFKNFFKKKKHQNTENQEIVNYKFDIGDYVKVNTEFIEEFGNEKDLFFNPDLKDLINDHIYKVVSQFNFNNTAGKNYDIYYGLIDLNTDKYKTIYEIHLDLVPEEEVHAKKYNL